MTDKRHKAPKVKYKRDEPTTKQSIFLEYILLIFRKTIWVLLELVHKRSQNVFIIDQEKHKTSNMNKFTFETPWPPDLSCKHWFTSSVWNFWCWVADVPPGEMSLAGETAVFKGYYNTSPKVAQGIKVFKLTVSFLIFTALPASLKRPYKIKKNYW